MIPQTVAPVLLFRHCEEQSDVSFLAVTEVRGWE